MESYTSSENQRNQTTETGLTVIWPYYKEKGIFEIDYSVIFCKNYLKEAISILDCANNWVDGLDEIDWDCCYENILFIGNPKLVVSSVVISNMIQVLNKETDVCAPRLTNTNILEQQGQLIFPLQSSSNYEEYINILNKEEVTLKESSIIENICFASTREFIKSNLKILLENPKTIKAHDGDKAFKIIENSLAFVFPETYGTEREDLIKLIPSKAKKILDIGSAEGSMGSLIKKIRPELEVDAIEPNTIMANIARPKYANVYNMGIEDFKPDIKYDVLICGDVIEHMENPWKHICRFFEMLGNNSHLILSIPNAGHWSLVMDMINGKFEYLPVGLTCITHIRWFTEKSITNTLENCGFEIDLIERQKMEFHHT